MCTGWATSTQSIQGGELTGTGDGRLFAFYFYSPIGQPYYLGEIDKSTGSVIAPTLLTGVPIGGGFAVAFWGGDFYFFTAPGGTTQVTRYRPADGSYASVAALAGAIVVGVGVSTCAPL